MYLKSIEVNGFKSFAHKMVFEFNSGITGIVGPNGSGKSNVADAVRWVLGEQSAKQLRGAKMEDVIFSGTEMRKPMGSAYVAITMDNSDHSLPIDFEEVTVARRVYRSGESEYLINGGSCRRKDIVELFFDTGVGKEGYSIIGQGQIDQILNGKPEDRRELFDEAAGIVKYKKNKAETEKSLEVERDNLERITDILTELDRQVGPLKKQSEKAKECLTYREKLKEYDTTMFVLENTQLTKELQELDEKVEIQQSDLARSEKENERAKGKTETVEILLEKARTLLEDENRKLNEEKLSKEKEEGFIQVLEEQINTVRAKESHYTENFNRLTSSQEQKKKELKEQKELLQKNQAALEAMIKERVDKESKVAFLEKKIQDTQTQIDELRHNVTSFTDNKLNVSSKVEHHETVKHHLAERMKHLEIQLSETKENKATQEVLSFSSKKLEQELLEQKQDLIQKNRGKQKKLAQIQERIQTLQRENAANRDEYRKYQARYESIRNMTERYDGYGVGIQRVMEQKKQNPGIVGSVADIIHVEKRYETAMEIALGGAIRNIVTKTQKTARDMIAFLKQNRYGRVTFLPLDAVKGRGEFPRKEALSEPGVLGPANELVQYDSQFDGLFRSLLGRTLIVDQIENATKIANKYHHSLRIVTLEGELLNHGGSMAGGAFKNKSNLLGRNRELSELEERVKSKKESIEKVAQELQQENDKIEVVRQEQNDILRETQEVDLDINSTKMTLKTILERQREYDEDIRQIQTSIGSLNLEQEENESQLDSLYEKKNTLEDANKTDEDQIETLEKELANATEKAEKMAGEVSEVHIKNSALSQEADYIRSNQERIEYELKDILDELNQLKVESTDVDGEVSAKEKEIIDTKKSIEKRAALIEELNDKIHEMEGKLAKENEAYKKAIKDSQETLEAISRCKEEGIRLENLVEKAKGKQESLLNYMWETYEMTYHAAKEKMQDDSNISMTELRGLINEMKQKIRQLGNVNLNAIEEYQEVSERYEFLTKQHEDIVKAEEQLVGIIEELEVKMREQFNYKFREIQTMFQKVFAELFGGGTARLELTEGDVLESGVRIIAQPPGKKLQNMMQLSGGEKALTAISLLFAIQNLKPSPFCLLDEIEAALDDSNVTRFAGYLHKLTENTQFIVITHRRGTMTAADILYGITMQEKGVSTLVSVNLIEDDLEE
ncbi:MAG: chromosome segregation protein SMC [Anaerostipes sp.]|jgi:chromosome segregation protein